MLCAHKLTLSNILDIGVILLSCQNLVFRMYNVSLGLFANAFKADVLDPDLVELSSEVQNHVMDAFALLDVGVDLELASRGIVLDIEVIGRWFVDQIEGGMFLVDIHIKLIDNSLGVGYNIYGSDFDLLVESNNEHKLGVVRHRYARGLGLVVVVFIVLVSEYGFARTRCFFV